MRKINLRNVSEVLSEKELKNVLGGDSGTGNLDSCDSSECANKSSGDSCTHSSTGRIGRCVWWRCSATKTGKICSLGGVNGGLTTPFVPLGTVAENEPTGGSIAGPAVLSEVSVTLVSY